MEVILLERVENLGSVGQKVRVKNGYGRNYLLPRKKALRVTPENLAIFEQRRAQIEKENATKRTEAEQKAGGINGTFVTLIEQAGEDGRLFGSVRRRDITVALADVTKTEALDRSAVALNAPIKEIGVFNVGIYLHPEVKVVVHVVVARSQDEADEAKREFLNPGSNKKKKVAKAEATEEVSAEEEQPEAE